MPISTTKHLWLILFVGLSTSLSAANYYWVNGSGNWSDLSHWATTSGGTVYHTQLPSEIDDIYFDGNSFVEVENQLMLDNPSGEYSFRTFDASELNGALRIGQSSDFISLSVYGGLVLSSLLDFDGGGVMTFLSSQSAMPVKTYAKLRNFTVNFFGNGSWVQEGSLVAESARIGGNYITQGDSICVFTGIGLYATFFKTLDIRGSSIYVKGTVLSTGEIDKEPFGILLSNEQTNIFWEAPKGWFEIAIDYLGYPEEDSLRFGKFVATGFLTLGLGEPVYFNSVNLDTSADIVLFACTVDSLLLHPAWKYTISGESIYETSSFELQFLYANIHFIKAVGECGRPISIQGVGRFEIRSTYPAVLENVILEDIVLRPPEGDNTSEIGWTAIASADLGGVEGIQFTSGEFRTLYWVGGSGDWYDANHWSLQSGGVGGQCPPTPFDDVIIDGLSTDGFAAITYNHLVNEGIGVAALCRSFDARQITSSIRIEIANLWLFGDVYLSSLLDYQVRLSRLSGWGDHQLHTAGLEMPHLLMGGKGTYNLAAPMVMKEQALLIFRRGSWSS